MFQRHVLDFKSKFTEKLSKTGKAHGVRSYICALNDNGGVVGALEIGTPPF